MYASDKISILCSCIHDLIRGHINFIKSSLLFETTKKNLDEIDTNIISNYLMNFKFTYLNLETSENEIRANNLKEELSNYSSSKVLVQFNHYPWYGALKYDRADNCFKWTNSIFNYENSREKIVNMWIAE